MSPSKLALVVVAALVCARCGSGSSVTPSPDVPPAAVDTSGATDLADQPDVPLPPADTGEPGPDAPLDGSTEPDAAETVEPETCTGAEEPATAIVVPPFLQRATPHEVTLRWATDTGSESRVEWGETEALGQRSCGRVETSPFQFTDILHHVRLTGLQPATSYTYRVHTGALQSELFTFRTPPDPASEASFRFVSMSDMQRDDRHPDKFSEMVQDGVLAYSAEHFGDHAHEELAFATFAGDLVDNGWQIEEWVNDFFGPVAPLGGQIPLYPALGNHESNTPVYFRYFELPPNEMGVDEEHWYWLDYSNVRLIGMDSNEGYRRPDQLAWLDGVLAESCALETVDFVFAQLHHPHRSELWTPGNTDFTGDVIARLETFATDCGKPTTLLFGHTHGYSRGQSRDHAHLLVNVATAGGAIDRWGEQEQADYEEFSVSTADYGFVVVEVEAGDAPHFRLSRVSRGDPENPQNNVVRDVVTVRRFNPGPAAPTPVSPADATLACDAALTLAGSAYHDDDDGDAHYATHWQIGADCDFAAPAFDLWRQAENWYLGEDLQAGDDLEDETVATPLPPGAYCWRLRYRDDGLAWSDWSAAAPFTVPDCE